MGVKLQLCLTTQSKIPTYRKELRSEYLELANVGEW